MKSVMIHTGTGRKAARRDTIFSSTAHTCFCLVCMLSVCAVLMVPAQSSADDVYSFQYGWGGVQGLADGQFSYPSGIGIDSAGNVYVADTTNSRIQKFDADGNFISKWGKDGGGAGESGEGDGEFYYPSSIAISQFDEVFVTDDENFRVQKFDADGVFITKWGPQLDAVGVLAPLLQPAGLAVDTAGNLFITDIWQSRIQKFGLDGSFTSFWDYPAGIGESDTFRPTGIAVDSAGNIYITDYRNCQVIKFSPSGAFVTSWGTYGSGDGQFDYPSAIAVGSDDMVYVADTLNNRIQKFESDGTFVTAWGVAGTAEGELNWPFGVNVSADGLVYVADTFNHRIQVFSTAPPTVVELTGFQALSRLRGVLLEWSTASEVDNAGFNLYRAECDGCDYVKINGELIPARGSATRGAEYRFIDRGIKDRQSKVYLLEDVDVYGTATVHGPVKASLRR